MTTFTAVPAPCFASVLNEARSSLLDAADLVEALDTTASPAEVRGLRSQVRSLRRLLDRVESGLPA